MSISNLQKHHLRLLCEIEELCSENNIKYSLAEHSAWTAVTSQHYHNGVYNACIMMTSDSLAHFKRVLAQKADNQRKIVQDGIGFQQGQTFRYVDFSSTLFDFKKPKKFAFPGVGVDIRILSLADSTSYKFITAAGSFVTLPQSVFDSYKRVCIEGCEFSLIENYDTYFQKLIAKEWRTKKYSLPVSTEPNPPYNLIYSEDLPFEQFFKRSLVKKKTHPFSYAKRLFYAMWRKLRYDKPANAPEEYKKYLVATEDRFNCWEQYYPQKEELLAIAANNPLDEKLKENLSTYIRIIEKHYKVGIGLSFDEDILQIVIPFLRKKHGEKYVEKFLAMIPKEYRKENIDETLRNKGIHHPLL